MQFSIVASGPASAIGAQVDAQVAREKARLGKEAEDFVEHVINSPESIKKHKAYRSHAFPGVTAATAALESLAAYVQAEIAHVAPDAQVDVAITATVHRPDPE